MFFSEDGKTEKMERKEAFLEKKKIKKMRKIMRPNAQK